MGGKRILVVDDQESMRDMLADLLDMMGHEARTASGGAEALDRLQQEAIDLVITDLNMPEMDGMELTKRIKSRTPTLPVIVITGYGTFHTERQVLASGADGYIPKPCTIHRVRETVNTALGVT
jgi:DNA-binding NtrC family response regulator